MPASGARQPQRFSTLLLVVVPCLAVFSVVAIGSVVILGACPAPNRGSEGNNRMVRSVSTPSVAVAKPTQCPTCPECQVSQLATPAECPTVPEASPCPKQRECSVSAEVDGEFGAVSDTESWRRFGSMTQHAKQCNDGFGFGLVSDWRSKGSVWCGEQPRSGSGSDPAQLGGAFTPAAKGSGDDPLGPTRFACYRTRQHRHTGDDNICIGEGFSIDTNALARQQKEPHIFTFGRGAMKGTCAPSDRRWGTGGFTMWLDGWMNAYQQVGGPKTAQPPNKLLQCDSVVDETVVFVSRDNWKHLYWQTAAFFNLFVTYNILGVQPDDVRIVLLDWWPKGPFESIMAKAFANKNLPLQSIEELAEARGSSNLCFRRAVFNLPEYAAAIVKGRPDGNDCSQSELLRAYASHVATRLGARKPMGDADNGRPVRVLFNSRRNYDNRNLLRQLTNEDALLEVLRSRHPSVTVESVDFAQLPFEKQIMAAASADVMIGVHGSGLAHCIWMPEDGVVVEITEPGGNLKTFRNLCKWAGKTYIAFPFTKGSTQAVTADVGAFDKVASVAVLIAQSYYGRIAISSTVHV